MVFKNSGFFQNVVAGALSILLALGLTLTSTGTQADPPPGKGKNKTPPGQTQNQPHGSSERPAVSGPDNRILDDLLTAGITVLAARLLADDVGLPLSSYKPLPPGIRKNLARGKPLPPGIAMTRLPDAYIKRLPSYRGYEWIAAGTDLLLVEFGSRIIADVLEDVFR